MARKSEAAVAAPTHDEHTLDGVLALLPIDAEVAADIEKRGSVVKTGYKKL